MRIRIGVKWIVMVFVLALVAAVAVACGASTPTPTPTATPTPTPTPTRTPTPTPGLITVNPQEDPEAFLQALPTSERDCMEQAFGAEGLREVVTMAIEEAELPPEDEAKIKGCLSEETARRIMLGMMFPEGISEQSLTCITSELEDVSFVDIIAQGGAELSPEDTAKYMGCLSEESARRTMLSMIKMELGISEQGMTCIGAELRDVSFLDLTRVPPGGQTAEQLIQAQTFTTQMFRAAFNCLSEEEAAEVFGGIEEGGGPSMEQYKCLLESADDETIAELFAMGAGAREAPEFLDIITRCGPIPGLGEEGGPPGLTPEQQSCVIEAIGEEAMQQLMAGQRGPTEEEVQKLEACTGLGEEGGPPELTPEQQSCVIESIGEEAMQQLMAGQRGPTPEEMQKILACGVELPGL